MKISAISRYQLLLVAALAIQFLTGTPRLAAQSNVVLEINPYGPAVQVEWTPIQGVLQSSSVVTGGWENVSVTSPAFFLQTTAAFFRVGNLVSNDVVTLDEGIDLYQSTGQLSLTLPPNFFNPNSQPFTGPVQLTGAPLETRGPFELGTADTIVHRIDPVQFPPPGSTMQVPIEFVGLSLVSVQPIVVTYPSAPPEQWQVMVQPTTLSASNATSQMTLRRTNLSGGTFAATLPVLAKLVFVNMANPLMIRTNSLPVQQMTGSNGVFSTTGSCSTDSLRVPRLPLGFCMQSIALQGSQLQLSLTAATASSHPPANVDPGATVHPNVASLGRFATISFGASVGPQTVIGPYAFIGSNAVIGANVLIGSNTIIGANAIVRDNSVVADRTQVGTLCIISSNTIIGATSLLGDSAQIGAGCRMDGSNVIGNGVAIGDGVVLERDVAVGDGASVADGLFVADGTQVGPLLVLTNDIFECELPNGSSTNTSCADCRGRGGAVIGQLSESNRIIAKTITVVQSVTNFVWNPTNPPAGLTNLQNDVNNAGLTTNSLAITNRPYVKNTYDCDDYAGDLEKALEALGYDATFTCYWHVTLNPAWTPENATYTKKWLTKAHAVTDVHTPFGIIWIEPQTGKIGINLDFDGDGKVEYDTKDGGDFTDNSARIEVYDSREAAEKAGVKLD